MTKIYFDGGGFWAMSHYIGAIEQLHNEYNKPNSKLDRTIHYYGNSAGGTFAFICYLVLNGYIPIDDLDIQLSRQFNKPKEMTHIVTQMYIDILDVLFTYVPSNIAELLSGVLYVGVSTKCGHTFVSEYTTTADITNVLLCSGTIAGFSNYESKIKNETCLDGSYLFLPKHIPEDAIIISNDTPFPLCLTIPDTKTHRKLTKKGKSYVKRYFKYGEQMQITNYDCSPLFMECAFYLHEHMNKCKDYKKHICKLTNSEMTN